LICNSDHGFDAIHDQVQQHLLQLNPVAQDRLIAGGQVGVKHDFVTPQLAAGDQILAVPTLVRRLPEPIKKIIGDLSDEKSVLVGLDIQPARA